MTKVERILFYLIGLVIWAYLGFRAAYVPLIHDEAVTYIAYIRDATFIPPWSYWDANNHLLNSALSALFTSIFGNSSFIIRLASWLSFPFLVFVLVEISSHLKSVFKRGVLVLPIISAPFLMEFYALSRGYGLSLTFFLTALLFAYRYIQKPSRQKAIGISIFGLLASLSSLSVIVVVLIIYGWVWLFQIIQNKESVVKITVRWLVSFIAPLLPLIYYVFLLKERGLLYYGGSDFIDITLKPMAELFFVTRGLWWIWVIPFVWISIIYLVQIIKNGWQILVSPAAIFTVVLVLSIVAIFTQHFLLDVNYPSDRAALYLFPLLILSLVFLPINSTHKWWTVVLGVLLFFPYQLATSFNTSHSKFWIYEHVPKGFVSTVQAAAVKGFPPTVNGYFLRSYIWDYQQLDKGYYSSTIHSHEHPDEWADFVLVDSNRINKLNTDRFDTVHYDDISGQFLLKQKVPNIEVVVKDTVLHDVKITDMYTNIFDFQSKELVGKPIALYYTLNVRSSIPVMQTLIITSVFDTNGVELMNCKYSFSQVCENWTDKKGWKVKLYLPPLPESSGRFVTYIFNPNMEQHLFPRIECELAEISVGELNSKEALNP
ncbi:MAG: hypothetical protein ACI9GM_000297 [Salibacteraceae bacterium]|jgi:hypothetical protein